MNASDDNRRNNRTARKSSSASSTSPKPSGDNVKGGGGDAAGDAAGATSRSRRSTTSSSGRSDRRDRRGSSRSRSRSRGRTGGASKRATAAILQQANSNSGKEGGGGGGGNGASGGDISNNTTATSRTASTRTSRGVSRNDSSTSARSSSQSRSAPRRTRSMRRSLEVTGGVGARQQQQAAAATGGEVGAEAADNNRSLSRSRHGSSTHSTRRGLPPRSQSFVVSRPSVSRSKSSTLAALQQSGGRQAPRRTKSACQGDLPSVTAGAAGGGDEPDPDLMKRRQRMKEMYRQNPSWEKNGQRDPKNEDGGSGGAGGTSDGFGVSTGGEGGDPRSRQLLRGSSHRHMRGDSWGLEGSVHGAAIYASTGETVAVPAQGGSGGARKDDPNSKQFIKLRQSRQDSILEVARKEKWQAQERKMAELDHHEESHFDDDSDEDESDEDNLKVKKKKTAFGKVTKAVKKTAKKTAKTSKKVAGKGLDVAVGAGKKTMKVSGKVANKTSHLIMNKKDHDGKEEYADYNPAELASRQRSSSLLDRVISTDSVSSTSGYSSSGGSSGHMMGGHSHHSTEDNYMSRHSGHSLALDSVEEELLVDNDDISSDEED